MSEPSWKRAEQVSGKRLDRRNTYTIVDGDVWVDVRFSSVCPGCGSENPYEYEPRGGGCEECGFTGRRKRCEGVPLSCMPEAVLGEHVCEVCGDCGDDCGVCGAGTWSDDYEDQP